MTEIELLTALKDCYCEFLATSIGGAPGTCCVTTHRPAPVSCCDGWAWVRLVNAYPSVSFPALDQQERRCPIMAFALTVELGIIRCAPAACGDLGDPCCASEEAAVATQLGDRLAMLQALTCCPSVRTSDVILGPWTAEDPAGGCISSVMTATIRFAL